tara:strand:+ start:1530 stop:1799 length:270 start_codon:yes stop_codon:yes gene_type:complete
MSKDWSAFNVKHFAIPMTMLVFGVVIIGFVISDSKKKPIKQYPIEVKCHWETNGGGAYPTMECDSINGDTLYKDGLSIVPKNIISISFK